MKVRVKTRVSKEQRLALVDACKFYASLLMDPRLVRNLRVDIKITDDLDSMGECSDELDSWNPRWFTIMLRQLPGDDDIFKTLAHEMVHVKQYAKNELGRETVVTTRGGRVRACKWKGVPWRPKKKECSYFDAPWEIEAYGREVGLYHRWVQRVERIEEAKKKELEAQAVAPVPPMELAYFDTQLELKGLW
jgi:hypothetical protein